MSVKDLDKAVYVKKISENDRAYLSRAITLCESEKDEHQHFIHSVLENLLKFTGNSIRIGISGTPGVGKSTFIEAIGPYLISKGHKVCVLAIDPSSEQTGGSILGDKTRMEKLSENPSAFIRPTPSRGHLGGVSAKTHEAILLCEAAGYDVIFIETVGVGQSEVKVSNMVDIFLLLMQPGAGDELQGIKRGILEVADLIAVNKADGDLLHAAESAASDLNNALHILRHDDFFPSVKLISAATNSGIDVLWKEIENIKTYRQENGEWENKRAKQRSIWLWDDIYQGLKNFLRKDDETAMLLKQLQLKVEKKEVSVFKASEKILDMIRNRK